MSEFAGQTVLITGGTAGIGRAAAEQFAAAGATVIVAGRDPERGRETVDGITAAGGAARFIASDLAKPGAAAQLAADAGEVNVLINNAGVFPFAPTHETDEKALRQTLDVNIVAPFQLTAAIAPKLVANGGGAIVNVSTMVARFGLPGLSAYGATKAAIELLTKVWAAEYGPGGVRVNAVAPGPTRTPGTEAMGDGLDQLASAAPLGRPADADEIARTIVFLASSEASFINGAVVPVDGGRTAV